MVLGPLLAIALSWGAPEEVHPLARLDLTGDGVPDTLQVAVYHEHTELQVRRGEWRPDANDDPLLHFGPPETLDRVAHAAHYLLGFGITDANRDGTPEVVVQPVPKSSRRGVTRTPYFAPYSLRYDPRGDQFRRLGVQRPRNYI